MVGVGFDRDVLREAGITPDCSVMAVTSGDNSNIISARVARETFRVPKVIARIYDPRRAEIYQRLGVETVASVAWTAQQMVHSITPELAEDWHDTTGTVTMAPLAYNERWIGERVKRLSEESGSRIAFITRLGQSILPSTDTVIQEGDKVHVLFTTGQREAVLNVLAAGPQH